MDAFKCDRCGEFHDGSANVLCDGNPRVHPRRELWDLCDDCIEVVREVLNKEVAIMRYTEPDYDIGTANTIPAFTQSVTETEYSFTMTIGGSDNEPDIPEYMTFGGRNY